MASVAMDYDSRKGLIPMCKVVETIDRPIESVWALCSAFGAIKGWMPGIESCVVREDKPIPPAYGAVRAVANLGMVMEETLEIFDVKNHFISYRLQDPCPWPLRGCRGSLKLEALNETKTQVTWSSDAEEISQETIEETRPQLDAFFKSGIAEARKILMRPQQVYM